MLACITVRDDTFVHVDRRVLRIGQVCLVCTSSDHCIIIICSVSRIRPAVTNPLIENGYWPLAWFRSRRKYTRTYIHTYTHAGRSQERIRIEWACVRVCAYMLCGQRDKNEYPERSVNTTHNGQLCCCLPTFEKPSWVTLIENTSLVIL